MVGAEVSAANGADQRERYNTLSPFGRRIKPFDRKTKRVLYHNNPGDESGKQATDESECCIRRKHRRQEVKRVAEGAGLKPYNLMSWFVFRV